jgi:DNA-binding MarR family transcriptional regulator
MRGETLQAWICTAMMRIGTRMATGFDQHFAGFGITQAQFRLLLAVLSEGGSQGIAPSSLADHLLIERGTVSVLSSRMVKQGWLKRKPGENRRSHRLVITEAGGQVLQNVAPLALDLAETTLAGFSPEQLDAMRASLELIENKLRALPEKESYHES